MAFVMLPDCALVTEDGVPAKAPPYGSVMFNTAFIEVVVVNHTGDQGGCFICMRPNGRGSPDDYDYDCYHCKRPIEQVAMLLHDGGAR